MFSSGCVTGRRVVSLSVPSTTGSSLSKGEIFLGSVQDGRVFENKPSQPSVPSIKGDALSLSEMQRDSFLLNLVLIIKGFFIDIFSAITIVVPLIAPLGVAYGINPVHLGIIFLANLELGYLTPPLGLNLFLASYRFEKPIVRIYRDVLPFQLVMLASVLIITYVPWMTTALLNVLKV